MAPDATSSPGALALALGFVKAWDERWSNFLFISGLAVPRFLWKAFEYSGDGLVWLAVVFALLASPGVSLWWRYVAANLLLGLLADLAEVGLLKALVRRKRPVYNNVDDFIVVVAVDRHSFPSGHSARVSFVASYFCLLLGKSHPLWVSLGAWWALWTALSRAMMGRHYFVDVLAGIALGFFTLGVITQVRRGAVAAPARLRVDVKSEPSSLFSVSAGYIFSGRSGPVNC